MKIKHLISTLLLSASLVTAGITFAHHGSVEKAEATAAAGSTFYLDLSSATAWATADSWAGHFQLEFRTGDTYKKTSEITKDFFGGVNYLYKFTAPSGSTWNDVQAIRCSSSGEGWNYSGFQTIGSGNTLALTLDSSWNVTKSMTSYFTVTFNANGHGTAPGNQYIKTGNKASQPTAPTASGWDFGGWYKEAGCTNAWNFSTETVTTNKTLYAKWTPSGYTVTKYKVLDGASPVEIESERVNAGTTYAVPANRYEAGYTFDGWYTTSACTTKYTAKAINADTGIYAKYTSGTWAGNVVVDLGNSGWADVAANYAVMFMDKTTYPSEIDAWSTYLTGTKAGTYQISVPYDIPFEPKTMLIARYNSSYSQSSWNTNKWPSSTYAWGQTDDIEFGTYVIVSNLNGTKNAASTYYPVIKGGTSTWTDKAILSEHKVNGSGHVEYFSTSVTLLKDEKFKSVVPSSMGDLYYGAYSTHSSLTSNFSGGGDSDITVLVGGTYALYFDSATRSLYITTVAIAQADEWAQYFLSNVGCDASGVNLPTGWSSCATEYAKLSGAAKDIVYGATGKEDGTYVERAVARYDVAVRNHSSLSRFIVDSGDRPRTSSYVNPISIFNKVDSSAVIISAVVIGVTALAVGGYFLLRKKKEN